MDDRINQYIDNAKEQMLLDLKKLVEIRSVRGEATPDHPFGEGPAEALDEALKLLQAHGFSAENIDYYALQADLGTEPALMLLAHLDVVDEGDGWTRAPYRLTREGDLVYGRGTTDDKGPAVACLYAMLACRETLGEPKRGVRLVLGCGEETGSEDMEHYFASHPYLPYTLSPDADYPLINIEKGRFAPFFTKQCKNEGEKRIVSVTGGGTQNIVPGKAHAVVAGLDKAVVTAAAEAAAKETGAAFTVTGTGEGVRIDAAGNTAHAASPEKGVNAQTALLALLCRLPLDENETTAAVQALCRLFPHGDTAGEALGVAMADAESGALTMNFGVLSFDNGAFRCGFDIRSPLCGNTENIVEAIRKRLAEAGFSFEGDPALRPVHYVPADSPLVLECLDVYAQYTGKKGECLAIGGGTYVHDIEGGVAFGVEFPGRDYRIHGADEFADIGELLLTAKMYAEVIRRLCY
ncbi:MAG: Sapep family Mn(2+)-dependent dipeptidase [Clostridia bacterium]|nr:Sapep family Mn(2+)-dependent dipeptidase [Clostridia bacterium]MBR0538355.1 Sapep family Mn(2+)-dependent dipeptidase [Clostridia bacterium]